MNAGKYLHIQKHGQSRRKTALTEARRMLCYLRKRSYYNLLTLEQKLEAVRYIAHRLLERRNDEHKNLHG